MPWPANLLADCDSTGSPSRWAACRWPEVIVVAEYHVVELAVGLAFGFALHLFVLPERKKMGLAKYLACFACGVRSQYIGLVNGA